MIAAMTTLAGAAQGIGLLAGGVLAELFDVVPVLDAQASLYLLCGLIAIVFLGSRRVAPRPGGRDT